VGIHGVSNRGHTTNQQIKSQQKIINLSDDNSRSEPFWVGHRRNAEWLDNTMRFRTFISDIGTHPPGMALLRRAWARLNRLRTGVGRFCFCLHKWDIVPTAACKCGSEEQTVDHVVLQCPAIDLPMDCTTWRFWMMRQSNGCSTPALRSSAA